MSMKEGKKDKKYTGMQFDGKETLQYQLNKVLDQNPLIREILQAIFKPKKKNVDDLKAKVKELEGTVNDLKLRIGKIEYSRDLDKSFFH